MIQIVIAIVLSIVLVNAGYRLFARITGADVMFYSTKKKLAAYIIVFFILLWLGL